MAETRDADKTGSEVLGRVASVDDAVGGSITLRPLGVSDYGSLQDASLSYYRREQIKLWTENADLIPEEAREQWVRDAFERAGKIEYADIPDKQLRDKEGNPKVKDGKPEAVEYVIWWMSATRNGKQCTVWMSARKEPSQNDIQLADISRRFSTDDDKLEAAAEAIGELSESRIAGNGEAPPSAGQKQERRRRKRRIKK